MAGSENRWYDDWQLIIYLVQLANLGYHAIAIQNLPTVTFNVEIIKTRNLYIIERTKLGDRERER